ncbi:MAG: ribonuclease HII [Syntrophaceae bacterium]|nr:ribonuclease HII [Syntrophaceae bacterium]
MDYFEKMYHGQGYRRVAGVDEAGRGPLAGPVVASAVILPEEGIGQKLFDSKKISSRKREELYKHIYQKALGVGLGVVHHKEIDLLNILQATLKAMVLAVGSLPLPPDFILIDGNQTLHFPVPQKPIRKGDQICNSIAAASIVAKVTRDRMMLECHEKYPQYHFAKHKGYGTKEHRKAIERFGICEIHRKTFRGVKEYL